VQVHLSSEIENETRYFAVPRNFTNFDLLGGRDWSENSSISGEIVSIFMRADFPIFVFPVVPDSFKVHLPTTTEISCHAHYNIRLILLVGS